MMVDNSIVVLESCFRATDEYREKGFIEYAKAALDGTNIVVMSIVGGTLTTCVVFIPLTTIQGMSGQMFKPLGYTIVFCMLASLLSAMTVVPLCYLAYKPKENTKAFMYGPVAGCRTGTGRLWMCFWSTRPSSCWRPWASWF